MAPTVPETASNALPNVPRKGGLFATIHHYPTGRLHDVAEERFDKTDRAILTLLQREGRIPNVELAERVALSPSSCLRRTKALEAAGLIAAYRAELDRQRLGLGLTVFISLRVEQHSRATSRVIEEALTGIPAVVACYVVSGEADFLVEAAVPDLAAYESLLLDHVLAIDAVTDARSTFAIRTVLSRGPLPVDTVR
jgi:Lrp/AsnC family transcriptional regulator, leucine-responsive regulatory protein